MRAAKDGEKLASFRALRLNLGVSDVRESWLLDPDTWADIERSDTPKMGKYYPGDRPGRKCQHELRGGLLAGDWGSGKQSECFLSNPPLLERGHSDGVGELYVRAAERGGLYQAGELVSRPCGSYYASL